MFIASGTNANGVETVKFAKSKIVKIDKATSVSFEIESSIYLEFTYLEMDSQFYKDKTTGKTHNLISGVSHVFNYDYIPVVENFYKPNRKPYMLKEYEVDYSIYNPPNRKVSGAYNNSKNI